MTMQRVQGQGRVLWILWGAMLASTGVYLVVLRVAAAPEAPKDVATALLLNLVGLAIAVASFILPLVLWSAAKRALRPVIEEVPDEEADPGLFRDAVPKKRVLRHGPALLEAALAKAQTPFILGLAMSETVCLLGFVLAFLGHPAHLWAPPYALGVVLLLVRAPFLSRLTRHLEAHFDARFDDLGN